MKWTDEAIKVALPCCGPMEDANKVLHIHAYRVAASIRDDTIRECLEVACGSVEDHLEGMVYNAFREHFGAVLDATEQR